MPDLWYERKTKMPIEIEHSIVNHKLVISKMYAIIPAGIIKGVKEPKQAIRKVPIMGATIIYKDYQNKIIGLK